MKRRSGRPPPESVLNHAATSVYEVLVRIGLGAGTTTTPVPQVERITEAVDRRPAVAWLLGPGASGELHQETLIGQALQGAVRSGLRDVHELPDLADRAGDPRHLTLLDEGDDVVIRPTAKA